MTRWTLMRAVRNAAPSLGLTPRALQLLETYIEWTYDADWAPGSEPIVITPLTETAETLGLSERQIRNLEAGLMRAGLLTFRDSGNHARRGRRCRRTGRLLHGFGPSLAPMAARAAEIAERAAAARAEVAACRAVRLGAAGLRRRLRADLMLLAEHDPAAAEALTARAAALPARLPAHAGLEALQAIRDRIRAVADDARAALPQPPRGASEAPALSLHISSRPEMRGRPNQSEIPRDVPEEPRACAQETLYRKAPAATRAPDPAALRAAGSTVFRAALPHPRPDWPAFTDAARQTATLHGIPVALWAEACDTLGRHEAALAIWLTDVKTDPSAPVPIRQPGAYLRGLLQAAREGRLNLPASISAALRRRAEAVAPRHEMADVEPTYRAHAPRTGDYPRITEVL
jgi:replication initiation protein RepC